MPQNWSTVCRSTSVFRHVNREYTEPRRQKKYIRTSLQKHAYSKILKISPPKTESLQIKKSDFFHISAQNIDYGYSLEPPLTSTHSMFLSRNKKHKVYSCKPQCYYIKVGFNRVKIMFSRHVRPVIFTSPCAFAQSDQNLHWAHFGLKKFFFHIRI